MNETTYNFSNTSKVPLPVTMRWAYAALFFIPFFSIWGNVLVCLSVHLEKRLKNRFNYFLVSLALSDLLCAILVMPVSAWKMIQGGVIPKVPREVCLAWYSLDVFFTATTICHLCTISTDRYFALKNPLKYHGSKRRISLVAKILFAWFVPFAIACPLFLLALRLDNPSEMSFKGCGPNNVYFIVISTSVTFFLPLAVMVVTYVLTVSTIIRQTRKAQKNLYPKSIATLVLRPNLNPYLRSKLIKVSSKGNGDCGNKHRQLGATLSLRPTAPSPAGLSPRHTVSRRSLSSPSLVIERANSENCFGFGFEDGAEEKLLGTTIRNEGVAESSFVEEDLNSNSSCTYSPCYYSPLVSEGTTPSPERRRKLLEPPTPRHSNLKRLKRIGSEYSTEGGNGCGTTSDTTPLRRRRHLRREHQRQMSYYNKSKKAVQVLGILFTLFVICYLPFFVVYLVDFFCVYCQSVTGQLVTVFEWIGYSGSMLNPIVYHIFNPAFRQTFHRLMRCNCERTRLMHHTSMRLT